MKNKINFVTGETYTLAELFSGNRRIIIPDLQRDYCWGDKSHTEEKKELVSGFVDTLVAQFEDANAAYDTLNLGLIYGYEAPESHIQLCDGQQRITTLFLLLGMLNKKSESNLFRRLLISDYEYLHNDKEPYLQYAIRESSLYFMSDLVCHFFITDEKDKYHVSDRAGIKKSPWFFNEYNSDPSIGSMLSALESIDYKLRNRDKEWCMRFGLFLTSRLTFMYYDMMNRKNGEETFVVINTTGEPLSSTQNLKPLIFTEPINKDYSNDEVGCKEHKMSEDWEEIETWFWKNRKNDNDTADAGFNEFLRWITMLHADNDELKKILATGKYTFPRSKISFHEIYTYWHIVKYLFELQQQIKLNQNYLSPSVNRDVNDMRVIGQIDCFQLLPLIAYCKRWGIPDSGDRNLLRLYQFVHNLTRIENVTKAVNELVCDVILIANSCQDVVDLADAKSDLPSRISTTILTKEETLKLNIIASNLDNREDIEDSFWQAQSFTPRCHKIWSGEILPLIEWGSKDGIFNLDRFKHYLEIFDDTFKGECDSNIDDVRRALLTRGLSHYPKIFRGNTNYSFGWNWEDWKILINENKDAFKSFFDDLSDGCTLRAMIDGFDQSAEWAEFVHRDYLLSYCQEKIIQWDDHIGWILIKMKRATKYISVNSLHLANYLQSNLDSRGWKIRIRDDDRVVVEKDKTAFYIWYHDSQWSIQFFRRDGKTDSLKQFVDPTWSLKNDRFEKSIDFVHVDRYNYPNVKELLDVMISNIDKVSACTC